MARIKLELPQALPFQTKISIRVTDLNYGDHLGNDALLGLIHEARVRFLRSLGYSEKDVEGVGLLMADCAIVYTAQGLLGEEITFQVGIGDWSRVGCDLFYLMTKADGTELARAKTGIVFFDYALGKVRPVPPGFLRKLEG
ncbi:MAG: thioesterase [Holophagaceae bacterium]|nr:thioesterase [Holophagaceae bacterium]